ncbi:MAG: nanoRNase/pAp phosphatase (c-di-AMP/oligoRNAs hydrolase) [Planctomycetota bacterium]|jgi:nanoRNase/pAp phosphatase (c-di-AMP/oligoRNAs hydrolase)
MDFSTRQADRALSTPADDPHQEAPLSGEAQPFAGLTPYEHLRKTILAANERGSEEVRDRFLVLTHRGPDPDALGACEGIRCLLTEGFGLKVTVATLGQIHRAENLAMVRHLELELEDFEGIDAKHYAGVLLVDTQPEFGHTVVPEDCELIAMFDHHVPPTRPDEEPRHVEHRDVRLNQGATCSMIYEYLRESKVTIDQKTAGALFCGIRYDTADLSRNAGDLDEEAYHATFHIADRKLIAKINNPPLPRHYYVELAGALTVARQHGPLVLALMGKVDNPESVAEMADFFLRMKGCSWVLAGAAFGDDYILSLRTDYAFGKAYPLMRRVLDGTGSFGGHGHIAGGRIKLEDDKESTIRSTERKLRASALEVIGAELEDGIPPEGRLLTE